MTERRAGYRPQTKKRARGAPTPAPILRAVSVKSELSVLADLLDGAQRLATAAHHEYDDDERRATQRAAITTLDCIKARVWQLGAAISGMLDPLMILGPSNEVEGTEESLVRFEEHDCLLRVVDDVRPAVASSQVPRPPKTHRQLGKARRAAGSTTRVRS